ncbi:winged helix-turn-helix transcriptional regulator [Sphingomonas sp. LY160]|uniref:winged helix-turn-helix transcriptional regulator n=1 Tax=Sphingomonas sp. LY160 TaxID=3095342 RepID=UPI002ADEEF4C|nr:winged helix-turn-helix transcriptional regulator [Sphingomonas sp. LY160]MEA1072630.1 winged helix-turn-helix transcriptional regulator [Sphingomonas sp. LY160]
MELEKVTNGRRTEPKRRYDDACGTAHALELIGERWALLVLRELLFGPRRFSELRGDLPGISANVLTQRLAELEERGLVRRIKLPPPASVQVYEATPWGLEVEPIVQSIGRWAARSPAHDPTLPISGVSVLLSFRTMISEKRAKGFDAKIGFRFGADRYVARIRKGGIKVTKGPVEGADAIITAAPTLLAAVVYGGQPLDLLVIEGDRAVVERFVTLFPLPSKVDAKGVEAGKASA